MIRTIRSQVFDGYHRKIHIIEDATGRILGTVRGSEFEKESGWTAFDVRDIPQKHVGLYDTETAAVNAVIRALEDQGDA